MEPDTKKHKVLMDDRSTKECHCSVGANHTEWVTDDDAIPEPDTKGCEHCWCRKRWVATNPPSEINQLLHRECCNCGIKEAVR